MKRRLWLLGIVSCCAALALMPAAYGQDKPAAQPVSQTDILNAVPADAWAALCIRNANDFDGKLLGLTQRLNLPAASLLQLAKMQMGFMGGFNDNGGIAVAVMPVPNIADPLQGLVVFIPCTDFAALTGMMAPQDAGEGLYKVMLVGKESYITSVGDYAVISEFPTPLKAVAAAKGGPGILTKWTKHQLDHYAKDDLTLWVNAEAITSSPAFQAMMPAFAMMSGGSFKPEELMDYRSFSLTVQLAQEGLLLGGYVAVKDGSAAASLLTSNKAVSTTLLNGLPKDDYLLTVGFKASKEQAAKMAQGFAGTFNNPMIAMQLQADPQKLARAVEIITGLCSDFRNVAFSISSLPASPDGMVSLSKVVAVEGNAKEKCAQFAEIVDLLTSGMVTAPGAQEAMKAVKYAQNAETLNGVSVDHLVINPDGQGVSSDELAQIKRILGKDGILIRLAAVDDKHIAATIGGGKDRMAQVIKLAKANQAPLSRDAGIKSVAGQMSKQKVTEGYVSIDNIMKAVSEISKVVGEDAPPAFPTVGKPAAFVAWPVANNGYQVDVVLPNELIVAIKDFAMSMQGAPAGSPQTPGTQTPGQ